MRKAKEADVPRVVGVCPVGPNKGYSWAFLRRVLQGLEGVVGSYVLLDGEAAPDGYKGEETVQLLALDAPETRLSRHGRIARAREVLRKAGLACGATHVYFHDSDVVPPRDIVPKLLAHGKDIVTGVYPIRLATSRAGQAAQLPLWVADTGNVSNASTCGVFETDTNPLEVRGFGFGCFLISRAALEATPFREPAAFADDDAVGEDYAWSEDARHAGFRTYLDREQSCWHVEENGTACRVAWGGLSYGVTYMGASHEVRNRFGQWVQGVTRYDITPEQAKRLGAEFECGGVREARIETAHVRDLVR